MANRWKIAPAKVLIITGVRGGRPCCSMEFGRTPLTRFPVPRKKGREMNSLVTRWTSRLGLAALLLAPLSAQGDGKEIKTEKSPMASAAKVDFQGELGIQLATLITLGARIDAAAAQCDPVALAGAAAELAALEEAAGKTASVKSADLSAKAAELAKSRANPVEIRVVAALVGKAAAAELITVAEEIAQKLEEKKDTKDRAVSQRLYVNNTTGYYIDIYVNGSKVGTVNPYNVGNCWVGDPIYGRTILYGQAPGTTMEWGPRVVAEPVTDYTWTLY